MFGLSWAAIRLIAYALLAATLLGGAAYVKHEWDAGQAARVEVTQAHVVAKAEDKAVVAVDKPVAKAEAAAQVKIVYRTKTLIKEIPRYVPSAPVDCVTWGLVRLHDAAVLHVDPASLPLPAGLTDGSCSPFTDAQFMAGVIANYGVADANAEQLDALEADIAAREKAVGMVATSAALK